MIHLPQDIEALALRLAAAQRLPVETAIRRALEHEARASGLTSAPPRRRMTTEQMLALGSEIAVLPIHDPRAPSQIMDELNAP